MTAKLIRLRPSELDAHIARSPILVVPIGTVEWHSYHLPLGTDGIIGEHLAEQIALRCDGVLAPTTWLAADGVPYPYTLRLPLSVVEPAYVAMLEQYAGMGFTTIVLLTGHFGLQQTLAAKRAALTVMDRAPVTVLALTPYDLVTEHYAGDHAGIGETSMMWSIEGTVHLDAIAPHEELDGVIGDDPRQAASAERGELLTNLVVERASRLVLETADATRVERARYMGALRAGVRVLAATSARRDAQPRSAVPPIATPEYLAYCSAMSNRDYARATEHAENKLLDLSC